MTASSPIHIVENSVVTGHSEYNFDKQNTV